MLLSLGMHTKKEPENFNSNQILQWCTIGRRKHLLFASALLLLLLLFRFSALTHFTTHYLGGYEGDAGLYIWLMRHNLRDLFSLPWFDSLSFYPYRGSLAWSDNYILPSLFAAPFFAMGFSETVVVNILLLTASFLNGYITFRLCFRISGESLMSFVAAAAFMTSPLLSFHLGHPQLQFFFWVPLALLQVFRFLSKPTFLNAALSGLIIFLTFLTTVYYSVFAVLAILVILGTVYLLRPAFFSRDIIRKFFLGFALGLFPVLPFVIPYLKVRSTFGERGIYEAYYFAANSWSYISSVASSFLYKVSAEFSHSEAHLFPGLLVFALAVMAFIRLADTRSLRKIVGSFLFFLMTVFILSFFSPERWANSISAVFLWVILALFIMLVSTLGKLERKLGVSLITARSFIAIFSAIALVFFIISLGPLGNPEKGQWAIAPYRLLYEVFPGFNSIRAVGRSGIMVYFAFCILGGLALSNINKKSKIGMAVLLPTFFILVENYTEEFPLQTKSVAPPVYSSLAKENISPGVLISLPLATTLDKNNEVVSWSEFARMNVNYMNWSFDSGHPIVNGYSGQKTKIMREFPRELKDFPSQRSLMALSRISGLRYIIYNSAYQKDFNAAAFEAALKTFSHKLKLIERDQAGAYLIELNGEIYLNEDLYLLVPANNSKDLNFEMSSTHYINDNKATVEIMNEEEGKLTKIGSIEIKLDGKREKFNIPLTEMPNRIRPLKVVFRPSLEVPLMVRSNF